MGKYEKGKIVKGVVTGIESYGVFVSFDEFYTGLIHISELSHSFVKDVHDFVNIGDQIYVEILDVDEESNHLKLSIKNIIYKKNGYIRRKKIIETGSGFSILAQNLPKWIKKSSKKQKN